tara:strand:+ start:88 stop:282 length:195 start_codon:yes stop_codon:yes gene_type:complete
MPFAELITRRRTLFTIAFRTFLFAVFKTFKHHLGVWMVISKDRISIIINALEAIAILLKPVFKF